MGKIPKFMLCENPMADYGQEYILHTQKPKILFKVIQDADNIDFEIVECYDELPPAEKLAGLIRRVYDWFIAYCDWEENHSEEYDFDIDDFETEGDPILEPKLEDAHAMSILHQETFNAPSNEDLKNLEHGDFVKVCASGERFWCEIQLIDFPDHRLVGTINNELVLAERHQLKLGDAIIVNFQNIYEIKKSHS